MGKKFEIHPEAILNWPKGSTRKPIWPVAKTKYLVYMREGGKCYLCHAETEMEEGEFHHVRAKRYGGSMCAANLVFLCKKCHRTTFSEYVEKVIHEQTMKAKYNEYWGNIGAFKESD